MKCACFQQDGSTVHIARQTDKHYEEWLQDIGCWMTLGVQHITWQAISHNLTMPNFSLHCFLEPKVLTNHPKTLKGITN